SLALRRNIGGCRGARNAAKSQRGTESALPRPGTNPGPCPEKQQKKEWFKCRRNLVPSASAPPVGAGKSTSGTERGLKKSGHLLVSTPTAEIADGPATS